MNIDIPTQHIHTHTLTHTHTHTHTQPYDAGVAALVSECMQEYSLSAEHVVKKAKLPSSMWLRQFLSGSLPVKQNLFLLQKQLRCVVKCSELYCSVV
jgi:hypothetical protein